MLQLVLQNIISGRSSRLKWKQSSALLAQIIGGSRSLSTTGPVLADIIIHSPHPPTPSMAGYTIPELVWSNLPLKDNQVAFECSVTGEKLTHGQIYKQSRNFATALVKLGLKYQDCVSIVMPNDLHFPSILLGILEVGGIVSPANPSYTADEIIRQVKVSESKIVITIPALLPVIRQALKECPTLKSVIVVGEAAEGCHTFAEMIKADSSGTKFLKGSDIDSDFVAVLPFSSGTTGAPKGVELTHFNICSNLKQYTAQNCANINKLEDGRGQDRLVGVLPFFHSYGLTSLILAGLFTGNHIMTIPKFTPESFIKYMRHLKPTVLTLVPPIIGFLASHPQVTAEDFSDVHTVQVGAAPLGPVLIKKLREKAQKSIFIQEMYGLTETSPGAIVLNPKFGSTKDGSCGSLLPSTSGKIADLDTGVGLGPNQRGELWLRGPQIMKGYYKNEEATRGCIDADGWFHTGDIGYYDEDECVFIVDRLKELIKVKGLQVAPAELEDLLRQHPEVSDCAVIGVPDEKSGELPRAYIVPKRKGLTDSAINEFLNGKISKHKELKGGIEFMEAIPKAPTGKILRRELKQAYLTKYGIK